MSNVLINVVSEFDQKGFKQADSSLNLLTKRVVKFTATLGLAHKAQQAVLDAMADEKATKILAQNLRNLGMAYAQVPAEQFIQQMQRQTGILDDELRPAYATLARVTGDMAKTQEILALAFDVSSGTGQDFQSVVNALSKAYVGNTKSLRSLNIGLTTAELQTKSFADITEILNKQFGGAGAASLETYAGKLAVLKAAAADASETIGVGFLSALQTTSGSTSIVELADKINNLAERTAALTRWMGYGAKSILTYIQAFTDPRGALNNFRELQKQILADTKAWNERNMKVWYPEGYQTAEMKRAAAAALARSKQVLANNKKITAEKKKQTELEKALGAANAMLNTAKGVFDLEQVSVAAALANRTLTENERKRLEIKQAIFALEAAIDAGDQKRITTGTTILGGLLNQFATLQQQEKILGQVKTAYDALGMNKDLINLDNLNQALAKLAEMLKLMNSLTKTQTTSAPFISAISTATTRPAMNTAVNVAAAAGIDAGAIGNALATGLINMGVSTPTALTTGRYTGQAIDWWNKQNLAMNNATNPTVTNNVPPTVNVTVTDNANKLVDVIMNTVTEQSASGNQPFIVRNGRQLAW